MAWGDAVALYAAIVSTLVGFIELYRLIRDTRSKLVIRLWVYTEDSVDDDNNVTSQRLIRVNIVNHSASDRVITEPPWLQINTSGSKMAPPAPYEFPKRLSPGDACEFIHNFKRIETWVRTTGASKLKATVEDTYGNHYESKWVNIA